MRIEVGLTGSNVATAFPSWRQQPPKTIEAAYCHWLNSWSRLIDLHLPEEDQSLAGRLGQSHDLADLLEAAYFGEAPATITDKDWQRLRLWMMPEHLAQSPDPPAAATLQRNVTDYLESSRIVQDIEGFRGRVH